jgi:hypothetical protein
MMCDAIATRARVRSPDVPHGGLANTASSRRCVSTVASYLAALEACGRQADPRGTEHGVAWVIRTRGTPLSTPTWAWRRVGRVPRTMRHWLPRGASTFPPYLGQLDFRSSIRGTIDSAGPLGGTLGGALDRPPGCPTAKNSFRSRAARRSVGVVGGLPIRVGQSTCLRRRLPTPTAFAFAASV